MDVCRLSDLRLWIVHTLQAKEVKKKSARLTSLAGGSNGVFCHSHSNTELTFYLVGFLCVLNCYHDIAEQLNEKPHAHWAIDS